MEWPACIPDLNTIDHAWEELKQKVGTTFLVLASISELVVAVKEEWANIPQERVAHLIKLMFRRKQGIITAKNLHTPY